MYDVTRKAESLARIALMDKVLAAVAQGVPYGEAVAKLSAGERSEIESITGVHVDGNGGIAMTEVAYDPEAALLLEEVGPDSVDPFVLGSFADDVYRANQEFFDDM